MKNIAQYFVDTVKSNETTTIRSDGNTKEETESKKGSKGKRKRVKIRISRTNTKERVCDIIESNNDMVDKTPSPFTKVNNVDKNSHETPKRSSLSQLTSQKLQNQDQDYLSLETNNVLENKCKNQSKSNNSENSLKNGKKHKKESRDKKNINNDISSIFKNEDNVESIDLIIVDSSDKEENNHEESNAFQILMGQSKLMQHTSPIKFLPQNEEPNTKRCKEYRDKLKHSKERLIALADKKGYSKRKLSEMEESEKMEQIIQNRIKAFKGEKKSDNSISTMVLSQRQPYGSLLNYFSKTPVDLTHTNITDMSTIVVKADVHVAGNSIKHGVYSSNSNNEMRPNKKTRSSLDFSQIDDINIIPSEHIDMSYKKRKYDEQQHNKQRWSLRVKLQSCEDENSLPDDSSSEEIFSPKSKAKLNMENSKFEITRSMCSEDLPVKNKNKKRTSKRINEQMKFKLKEYEQSECLEDDIVTRDNKHLKTKFENKHEVISGKQKSTLTQNKNLNNYVDTSLGNIDEVKLNHEDCIIINDNNSKSKTTDKLAPLFTKRQKPDAKTIAARRLFLQPDITDKNNKSIDRKVNVYGILPFPVISHVTQLSSLSCSEINNFDIPEKIYDQYVPVLNIKNYKHIMDFSEVQLKPSQKIKKPKIQEVLIEIEKSCSDARKMWDIVLFAIKGNSSKTMSPKLRSKRSKQLEKKEIVEYKNKENRIESCSWTYKYRPKSANEVVGNEEAAAKLKEWLIGWKATFTNENASSGDEFYSSDCSSTKISENNQVAVLLGPHGSGKTASVYAVAEEFGYTVLEVNASSRRTGKKLLKELKEATESHRIKKEDSTFALFNSVPDEIVQKKISQNSLILIEDVDLVFEEDEGFISATYQLASNTKRPIVMTCRGVCPHLSKIAPQQNRIYFQSVVGNKAFALLELISLAETGYKLPYNYVTELVQTGDLRKAILQLQYLMLSGPTQILEQPITFTNSFWQNMRHSLYKPAIKVSKRQRTKKVAESKIMNNNKDILNDLASKLDNIVLLSSLIDVDDTALNLWQIKSQPSLSLIENTASYSVSNNICLDIAEWISKKVMYENQLNEYNRTRYQNNISLKKQLNKGINLTLSHTTSLLLDHRIVATDYFPSVRTICRAEDYRANMNNKRGNRFFHYLHSLKVPLTSMKPNILTAACRIMHDKVDNDTPISENSTSFM